MKPFTLAEIASVAGAEFVGPGDLVLSGIAPLSEAGPGDLSFVADARHARAARSSRAGALIVARTEIAGGRPALICPNPMLAMARVLTHVAPEEPASPGISPRAVVSASASLGPEVSIAAGAVVEDGVVLGRGVVLGPNVFVGRDVSVGDETKVGAGAVIEQGCRIGARCRLAAGVVIGADGFGYVWDGQRHTKIPQIGIVVIEDEVEIGANACIDRATLAETRIGRGTKIDNLAQIGHNVSIGEHSIICGQVGIAGSARIGRRVTLAGQAGIGDRMIVHDGATVTGQAGVMREVPAGAVVSGMPAEPHADFLRREAAADRLPEVLDRLRAVEEQLKN